MAACAMAALLKEIERDEQRKKEQAEKGLDGLTFFVYRTLLDAGITNAEAASKKIRTTDEKQMGLLFHRRQPELQRRIARGGDCEVADYVIVHELLHFFVPNHGKLWKSLMRAHLGEHERVERKLLSST